MCSHGLFLLVCLLLISREGFEELPSRPPRRAAEDPIPVGDEETRRYFCPTTLLISSLAESSALPGAGLSGTCIPWVALSHWAPFPFYSSRRNRDGNLWASSDTASTSRVPVQRPQRIPVLRRFYLFLSPHLPLVAWQLEQYYCTRTGDITCS